MKRILRPAVCALALILGSLPPRALAQTPAAAQGDELSGEWEGFLVEGDGSQQGQRRMSIALRITGNKVVSSGAMPQTQGDGTYTLTGGTAAKRHIDGQGGGGQFAGKTYLGICTVEGDTLKWCSADPGRPRPEEFRSVPGGGGFLMILHRKKS